MDTSEAETVSTPSLYATLGLSPEDMDALAQIPESEISVETLPYFIMQLKAKRTHNTSATSDTDNRDKSTQDKPDTPEKSTTEKRRSPQLSSSTRRSGSHDREQHAKGESHRRVDRSTGGRRDSRYRKSSRESGDDVAVEVELGDNPTVFPHECFLCKCVVNSLKTWKEHFLGARHQSHESRVSHRSSRSSLPPKRPYSSEPVTGKPSMSTTSEFLHPPKFNTRVVVAKFPRGTVTVEELLGLGKPFGTIVKNLVLPAKGFLEFSSHKEAQNMVSHYKLKPAFIKENLIILYLSLTADTIHPPFMFDEPLQKRAKRSSAPSVVCLSRLPAGEGVEAEVLELAGMFGEVQQSEITNSKALIEMVNWRDADIMVKYYYSNPLRIQGKSVKVTMTSITSLRKNSPDALSRKSDSSKNSRQREESSSSNKDKNNSSSQEATAVHVERENEGIKREDEKMLGEKEGIQMEEEPALPDNKTSEISVNKEEGEKKGEEERTEEEDSAAKAEENRERPSEENLEEQESLDDEEFPENLDDFVTLDELDNTAGADSALDSSETQGGKVLMVWPVKKIPDLTEALSSLCAPFSSLVKHSLSLYKKEAMVELETVEKAQEMLRFYKDHKATICGHTVSVFMCNTMKTIETPSGRSVFISGFPNKYVWQKHTAYRALLNLAKPFGNLTGYFLNKQLGTCYMQLESTEAAEKMVEQSIRWPRKFWGLVLKVARCRKGDSLIRWKRPKHNTEEREFRKEAKKPKSTKRTEKDQMTKSGTKENHHSSLPDCEGVCVDPVCETPGSEDIDHQEKTLLGPYLPDHSVGVNYVIPVTGFFCQLCNMFYSNEKRAKSEHCHSLEHYNNLKKKHDEVVEDTDGHPDG